MAGPKKLNPDVKKKFLAELRSGKYRQGTGALKKIVNGRSKYCCLGVLAEVIAPGEWRKRAGFKSSPPWKIPKPLQEEDRSSFNTEYAVGYLPETILDYGIQQDLAAKNDKVVLDKNGRPRHAYGFKKIAQYVEENL